MSESWESASPCRNVCKLNDEGVCLGCYRTLGEIAIWSSASSEERRLILERVREREEARRKST